MVYGDAFGPANFLKQNWAPELSSAFMSMTLEKEAHL